MHRLTRNTETMIRQWIYEEERRIAETNRYLVNVLSARSASQTGPANPYTVRARKAA